MAELTGLEKQKEEVKGLIFGNPGGLNSSDKSMLEISDTNRLIFDRRQSELQLAIRTLHMALRVTENRHPEKKRVQDPNTGQWRTETVVTDCWGWLTKLDGWVMSNQLTIKGYSRAQHLRQSAQQAAISVEEEQAGFWERLFGGR